MVLMNEHTKYNQNLLDSTCTYRFQMFSFTLECSSTFGYEQLPGYGQARKYQRSCSDKDPRVCLHQKMPIVCYALL